MDTTAQTPFDGWSTRHKKAARLLALERIKLVRLWRSLSKYHQRPPVPHFSSPPRQVPLQTINGYDNCSRVCNVRGDNDYFFCLDHGRVHACGGQFCDHMETDHDGVITCALTGHRIQGSGASVEDFSGQSLDHPPSAKRRAPRHHTTDQPQLLSDNSSSSSSSYKVKIYDDEAHGGRHDSFGKDVVPTLIERSTPSLDLKLQAQWNTTTEILNQTAWWINGSHTPVSSASQLSSAVSSNPPSSTDHTPPVHQSQAPPRKPRKSLQSITPTQMANTSIEKARLVLNAHKWGEIIFKDPTKHPIDQLFKLVYDYAARTYVYVIGQAIKLNQAANPNIALPVLQNFPIYLIVMTHFLNTGLKLPRHQNPVIQACKPFNQSGVELVGLRDSGRKNYYQSGVFTRVQRNIITCCAAFNSSELHLFQTLQSPLLPPHNPVPVSNS